MRHFQTVTAFVSPIITPTMAITAVRFVVTRRPAQVWFPPIFKIVKVMQPGHRYSWSNDLYVPTGTVYLVQVEAIARVNDVNTQCL